MVNAIDALLRSPMLFRVAGGALFLSTGVGRPTIGEETTVNARGQTSTTRTYTDHGFLSVAWTERPVANRYSYGAVKTLMEISDLTLEKGVYNFTVEYREYETRQGKNGEAHHNYYSSLPSNASVYIENHINQVYDSVMKEHFPNMRNKDSFFEGMTSTQTMTWLRNPQTIEEVFGTGVTISTFTRAQEDLCSRLREFYTKEIHSPVKFKVGDVDVPKWQRSRKPDGFHFALIKSKTFTLSLKAKFAKDVLVTPTAVQHSRRVESYRKDGGHIRTSQVGEVLFRSVFFKATLPERVSPNLRMGQIMTRNNSQGWQSLVGDTSNTGEFRLENLSISKSGTKARPKRGAWQGPYTGISKLKSKIAKRTYLEYVSEYGMPNCEPSLKSFTTLITAHTTALEKEGLDNVLTPKVDISPIELGHVNLYRLGNPMYELKGTHLNDYLVPSLKDFILSISEEKVLTLDPEHQVECVGNDVTCKTIEQYILPAGSYLVKMKDFCNKHHDANRPEYNLGMGAFVNLRITTRNVLRVIKVHDGQIREDTVEFVGAEAIATTFNDFDTFDDRW